MKRDNVAISVATCVRFSVASSAQDYLRGQQQLPLLSAEYRPEQPKLYVAESASVPAYKTRRSS